MIKVEALEEWKKQNLKCKDLSPERIPEVGEQWEVDETRLEILLGKNSYGKAFVKVAEILKEEKKVFYSADAHRDTKTGEFIGEPIEVKETTKEKPIKKDTAKKQPKKK